MGTVSLEVAEGCLACPESRRIHLSLSASMKEPSKLWLTHLYPAVQNLMNFLRKFTFISLHCHPWRSKPKLQNLCCISVQNLRFPETSCPGTSSTRAPPALSACVPYCFQREAPLLSPASPSCLPWEMYSTGKKISLPQMSFWVDPVLSQLPTVPRSSVAGGPGTSQHGGREARATPWARGLWCLWNCVVNFRDAEFETSWWAPN